MFFPFDLVEAQDALASLLAQYFPGATLEDRGPLNERTRLKQQRLILALSNDRSCDAHARQPLAARARQVAMVSGNPVYIFRELLHDLEEHRLVAPGDSVLQDMVSTALTEEQARLTTILRAHLTPADMEALQHLLEDAPGVYEITQLKREPKDFSAGAIRQEIRRGDQLRALYGRAQQLLPALQISQESIKYYASLVTSYSVFRMKRLDAWVVSLSLLCCIYHRYQRLHDHLLERLIYHVRQDIDAAKDVSKERVYTSRIEGNHNLHKAGQVLKLFTDGSIPAPMPFQDVQAQALRILARPQLDFVADHIATNGRFDETAFPWDHIDGLAPQLKVTVQGVSKPWIL